MTPTERLKGCKPALVRKVTAIIRDLAGHGISAVVVEGKRSAERQATLYAQGRTTPGKIVTWTLHSPHLTGRAADLAFMVNGKLTWAVPSRWWKLLGSSAEAHDLQWGVWVTRHGLRVHTDEGHVQLKED